MTCDCGTPGCQGVPGHDRMAKTISEQGQCLIAVIGSEDANPFVYTIGRTDRGEPELLIEVETDEDIPGAAALLNFLGPRKVEDGHLIQVDGHPDYMAILDDPEQSDYLHEEFVIQADRYYGQPVEVLCLATVAAMMPSDACHVLH